MATRSNRRAPGPAASIVVHDCSGHPFQVQLSRWLAAQGFAIVHLHCPSVETPKGALTAEPRDPPTLSIRAVPMRRTFAKYALMRRILQEVEYGIRLAKVVCQQRPRAVISSNTPVLAAVVLQLVMGVRRIPLVFWLQDIYSVGIAQQANRRSAPLGKVVEFVITRMEGWVLRASAAVVAISEDHRPIIEAFGVEPGRVRVIENWAPLAELPPRPRDNRFAREHALDRGFVFLYAGTLGLKHDPSLLLALAERYADRSDVKVVVASEGRGADWLTTHGAHLANLILLPFQPYELLPDVLASADVLIVILEPDAGVFSVPSKVLTYHCAGRAILAAVPTDNLAARIVERERTGLCVEPANPAALVKAAEQLEGDADLRTAMAARARAYAERVFDIDDIGRKFSAVLNDRVGVEMDDPLSA